MTFLNFNIFKDNFTIKKIFMYFLILTSINLIFFTGFFKNNLLNFPHNYLPIFKMFCYQSIIMLAIFVFFSFFKIKLEKLFLLLLSLITLINLSYIYSNLSIIFEYLVLIMFFFIFLLNKKKINKYFRVINFKVLFLIISIIIIFNFKSLLDIYLLDVERVKIYSKEKKVIKENQFIKEKGNIYILIPDSLPNINVINQFTDTKNFVDFLNLNKIDVEDDHVGSNITTFEFMCNLMTGEYSFRKTKLECLNANQGNTDLIKKIKKGGYKFYYAESGNGFPFTCSNKVVDQCMRANRYNSWTISYIRESLLNKFCNNIFKNICDYNRRNFNTFQKAVNFNWQWKQKHLMLIHILSPHEPVFYDKNCMQSFPEISYKDSFENEIKCTIKDIEKAINIIKNKNKNTRHTILIAADTGTRINKITDINSKDKFIENYDVTKSFLASDIRKFCKNKIPSSSVNYLRYIFSCNNDQEIQLKPEFIYSERHFVPKDIHNNYYKK